MLLFQSGPTVQFLVNGDTLDAPSHKPTQVRPPTIPRTISYEPLWLDAPFYSLRFAPYRGLVLPGRILDHLCRFSRHSTNCFMQGMEECYELGLTKAIGLSNFNSVQLQRVLDNCKIKPANLQVPCNFFSL